MTIDALTKSLEILNESPNDWFAPKSIHYLIMKNDGNHFVNQYQDDIYFDTTKGIIKLRKISRKLVSTRFLSAKQSGTEVIVNSINGLYTSRHRYFGRIRFPEVGDKVYTINDSLVKTSEAIITNIVSNGKSYTLTTDTPLGAGLICYQLKESLTPNIGESIVIWNGDASETISQQGFPQIPFHTYLAGEHVTGISMYRDKQFSWAL